MPNSVAVVDLPAPSLGVVTNVSRYDAPPSTAQDIRNMDVDRREGALITRRSWRQVAVTPTPGGVPPMADYLTLRAGTIQEVYITKNDGTSVKTLIGVFAIKVGALIIDDPFSALPEKSGAGVGSDGDEGFSVYVAKKEPGDDSFVFLDYVMAPLLGTPGVLDASIAVIDGQARIAISVEQILSESSTLVHSPVQWLGWIKRDWFSGSDYSFNIDSFYLQGAALPAASTQGGWRNRKTDPWAPYVDLGVSEWYQINPRAHDGPPEEPDKDWVPALTDHVPPGSWRYAACLVYGIQYGPLDIGGSASSGIFIPWSQRTDPGNPHSPIEDVPGRLVKVALNCPPVESGWAGALRATAVAVFRSPSSEASLGGYRLIGQVSLDSGLGEYDNVTIVDGDTSVAEDGHESQVFVDLHGGNNQAARFVAEHDRALLHRQGEDSVPFYLFGLLVRNTTAHYDSYPIWFAGVSNRGRSHGSGSWEASRVLLGIGSARGDTELQDRFAQWNSYQGAFLSWQDKVPDQTVSRVIIGAVQDSWFLFDSEFPAALSATGAPGHNFMVKIDGTYPNPYSGFATMDVEVFNEPLEGYPDHVWHARFIHTWQNPPRVGAGDTVRFYRQEYPDSSGHGNVLRRKSFFGIGSPLLARLICPPAEGEGSFQGFSMSVNGQELTITGNDAVDLNHGVCDGYNVIFARDKAEIDGVPITSPDVDFTWPDSPAGGVLLSPAAAWATELDYTNLNFIEFPDHSVDINGRPRWVDLAGANVINPTVNSSLVAHAGGRLFYGNITAPPQAPGDEEERFGGVVAYSTVGSDGYVLPDIVDPANTLRNVLDGSEITGLGGLGDRVVVWTRRSVYRVNVGTGYPGTWAVEHNVVGAGCISSASVVETPFGWIYLSLTGVRAYDNAAATVISTPIHDQLQEDITADGTNAFAAYDASRQAYLLHINSKIWVGLMPGGASQGVRWTRYGGIDDYGMFALGRLAEGGVGAAIVKKDPTGDRTDALIVAMDGTGPRDLGTKAITSTVTSQDIQVGGPGGPVLVQYVFVDVESPRGTVSVFLDGATTATRSVGLAIRSGLRRAVVPINHPAYHVRTKVTGEAGTPLVVEKMGAQVIPLSAGIAAYTGHRINDTPE